MEVTALASNLGRALLASDRVASLLIRDAAVSAMSPAAHQVFASWITPGVSAPSIVDPQSVEKLMSAVTDARISEPQLQICGRGGEAITLSFLVVPFEREHLLVGATSGVETSAVQASALLFKLVEEHGETVRALAKKSADLGASSAAWAEIAHARSRDIATLSHDLKSPLGALRLQAASMKLAASSATTVDLQRSADFVERVVDRTLKLINVVLESALLDAGTIEVKRELVSLVDVVAAAADVFGPIARDAGVSLEVSVAPEPSFILGERTRLDQVLANLLDNAIRHSPRGGAVTIALENLPESVLCTVSDDGPGVPEAQRDAIFDPFRRGTGHPGSAGLGLAIARQFVGLHGGQIAVGDAPSGGAAFRVRFPRVPV